jgi:hypothetical protein
MSTILKAVSFWSLFNISTACQWMAKKSNRSLFIVIGLVRFCYSTWKLHWYLNVILNSISLIEWDVQYSPQCFGHRSHKLIFKTTLFVFVEKSPYFKIFNGILLKNFFSGTFLKKCCIPFKVVFSTKIVLSLVL